MRSSETVATRRGLDIDLASTFLSTKPSSVPIFTASRLVVANSRNVSCMGEILSPLHCPLQPFREFEPSQSSFNSYLENFYLRDLILDSILFSFIPFTSLEPLYSSCKPDRT